MKKILLKNWKLSYGNTTVDAQVPGDITADLHRAGKIAEPYFGMNHRKVDWIEECDFTYTTQIHADSWLLSQESVLLVFDGVDTFASIFLNGNLLGETENMFLRYQYEIAGFLHEGENSLTVEMHSTRAKMRTYDASGYYATFNTQRLFIRKAQCHFGWDWAPDLCGYGIWQDVYLEAGERCRVDNVYVVADVNGNVTFFTELNYNINCRRNSDGEAIASSYIEKQDDTLEYYISECPFSEPTQKKTVAVKGKKNFACFTVRSPRLWWPIGYGEHPLYNYRVVLRRGGKEVFEKRGRFAFREVALCEKPKGDEFLGYALKINGKEVFVKGSNWVPADCFTGTVTDQRYQRLIRLAREGNCNMLRVWGGGIYEKDIFYDLCDENGIMVWQDIMFACADIPEDDPAFVENVLKEVEYQVKRLRNHPSLVYWCGGNEKTGSYGLCITKGDFFTECILRGQVTRFDCSRPFASQSPCSRTDVGNDITSGESHYNSFERALVCGMKIYRKLVAEHVVPFISEAAVMGPNSIETAKKIFPAEKLWPMNEVWEDRLMTNPYGAVNMTFCERQRKYCADLYGEAKSLADFTAKGMLVHAEALRAEVEFARSNKGACSGFLNWMFNDIWPSGSWSVVDYWGEPKQAYYQLRRSYAPLLVTFVMNGAGRTELIVVNDTTEPYNGNVRFGKRTFSGKLLAEEEAEVNDLTGCVFRFPVSFDCGGKDAYLFAEYRNEGCLVRTVYSPAMWSGACFKSDYSFRTEKVSDTCLKVVIRANSFAKSVFVSMKDNYQYIYSDNYIDVEAGMEKTVVIRSEQPIDERAVTVTDFAAMTSQP